ncbi:uncharacterized protein BP5553_07365 [Venustampulla echinocandica]|uniref:Zn(2)-C6 fungal-type domain-containing protein n=1 Tax=Venustampulla echinocandica TaxID=2656787 RepID=A0A370TJ95_9HELO|nr:uncharacterized protein BP5553_07365 [Venustampulla echinocandica]RDL35434.1 hypothetical protein BP5553_07365 [Venustampulla echinocandica]
MSSGADEEPHSSAAPEIGQNQRKHPCVLCQQRKVRCDRNSPCANCTKARVECVSPAKLPHKRRKRRFPEAELLARLRKYEEHLRGYGADIDAINREETPIPATSSVPVKTEDPAYLDGYRSLSVRWSLKNVNSNLWNDLSHEFRDIEEILQGSSDDELETPITTTYDEAFLDAGDLLLPGPAVDDLASLHPPPVQIFRLWQTFLDNINPLIKLFHAPTVQQQVLEASANLNAASTKIQVLMFGIYSMAIASLSEEECKVMFDGDKETLLNQYQSGARQALLRASFLRTSDMTILQGYMLYLYSFHSFALDPRALFCLTGIAIRMAQRMGLNFDGTLYGLMPFEIEMRRRLWWQLLFLDSRVGEISGFGPSILQHTWTTKLPSNMNDSDLFPDMRDPTVEHLGITEMVFVLQKCEAAQFMQQFKSATGLSAIDQKAIDDFEQRLEQRYLKYCDPQVPVHLISRLVASTSIAKLRIGVTHPHLMSARGVELSQAQKDSGFILSLCQIKNHQTLTHSKSLGRFQWYVNKHFPFPAYLILLRSLRERTSDALADEAWKILEEYFDNRPVGLGAKWRSKQTLHVALANLVVKAWEAREAAGQPFQPMLQTPQFILRLKQDIASHKSPASIPPTQSTGTLPEGPSAGIDSSEGACMWIDQPSMDVGAGFDDAAMPGAIDSSSWAFWGDYMQIPIVGQGFDGGATQEFYQN